MSDMSDEAGEAVDVSFRISGSAMEVIHGGSIYASPTDYEGQTQGGLDAYTALRAATTKKVGRGVSWTVTTSPAGARVINEYCREVGENLALMDGAEEKADARVLLKVANTIRDLGMGY